MTTSELYEWTSDQFHYPDTIHVVHQPTESIRILNVELLGAPDELDISYVQVANVMLAMFSKYIPICAPAFTIHVFVQPLPRKKPGERPAPFKVRITATRVPS